MSGRCGGRARGRGGRGNVNMTAAELNALINDRVAEALAAFQNNQGCEELYLLLLSVHIR